MAAHSAADNEARVLAAAQQGERTAQAILFNKYRDRVAQQVLRMCGDKDVVDDLVQETFISAFAALPRFRGDARLSTWLYTIAANRVRNYWDAKRRRVRREEIARINAPKSFADTPEEDLAAEQQCQRFYSALGSLPDKFREAFVARAIEGMGLAEASEVLGAPISTVSFRTRRAEEILCEALGIPLER